LLHALVVALSSRRAVSPRDPLCIVVPQQHFEIELASEEPEAPSPSAVNDVEPSRASAAPRAGSGPRVAAAPPALTEDEVEPNVAAPGASGVDATPPAAAASAAAPHLSLAALGVDGANPFIDRSMDPAAAQQARAARVKQRLDRALAQGSLNQDSAAGRGSASPVLRALEGAVYASTVPLTAQATFSFVIDGSGKLLSSSLGEAQGDRAAWLKVAHDTARALAGRTLSVPHGKSVKLTVAVTTRLELPSGADPGVEVDVLGIPVKKGAGKRSTRLEILNPLHPLAPLSLLGDPADIGARARRMVNAHVVSEELL
jgi:hypothetical protein